MGMKHFIKVPVVTLGWALSSKTTSVFWREFQTPSTSGLVRDIDRALCKEFFNITQTQREPHVEPHRVQLVCGGKWQPQ
ncbi:MAG: hypothetical protein ACI8PT_000980 [Gammaproteobacteria bacterium]|jgi:hypothetical protein